MDNKALKDNICVSALELLKDHSVLTSNADLMAEISQIPGMQGGCSDGKRYYYLALVEYDRPTQENNRVQIVKVDLQEKKIVKTSAPYSLHHANDMTYNPVENLLVVAHNAPHSNLISLLDADTLELLRTIPLPLDIYAIDYNAKRNQYAVGVSRTLYFTFLNADFTPVDSSFCKENEQITKRYTKQGMCADDELIYFILWDGKHKHEADFQNLITVYRWNGEFAGVIEFDVGIKEPENLSIVNGEIVACVASDAKAYLYGLTPKIKE